MNSSGYALIRLDDVAEASMSLQLDVNPYCWVPGATVTSLSAALYSLGAISVNHTDDSVRSEYKALFTDFYPESWGLFQEFFVALAREGGAIEAYFQKNSESILVYAPYSESEELPLYFGYNEEPHNAASYELEITKLREQISHSEASITRLPPRASVMSRIH